MINFQYQAPTTVQQAVDHLSQADQRTLLLAGGTDVLIQLREGRREADHVVDLKRIPELTAIEMRPDNALSIGAAATCYQIQKTERLAASYGALLDAVNLVGSWQIQCRASVGGNLCNGSPAADTAPPLLVHDATCVIAGPEGERTVQVKDFFVSPGKTVLQKGELLVRIEFPPPSANSASSYFRFIPRNEMDIAVAGAASWLQLDDAKVKVTGARIALAAVAPTPVIAEDASQWLIGQPANEASFREAGQRAKKAAHPIDDKRGSADYRVHLASVLTHRSLVVACERVKNSN